MLAGPLALELAVSLLSDALAPLCSSRIGSLPGEPVTESLLLVARPRACGAGGFPDTFLASSAALMVMALSARGAVAACGPAEPHGPSRRRLLLACVWGPSSAFAFAVLASS